MLAFLQQPYPLAPASLRRVFFIAFAFSLFVVFVLLVFQPFGIYTWHSSHKIPVLIGFGLVAGISIFCNFFLIRYVFPAIFNEENWQIWKEMVWWLLHFVIGGFLSCLYGYGLGQMPFSLPQISYMVLVAFLIGILPSVGFVSANYLYLIQKYGSAEILSRHSAQALDDRLFVLSAENEKDTLSFSKTDLLFIEAADNYCTVFCFQGGKIIKSLLRSSLNRLENQVQHPDIRRCHRSYVVNFAQVQSVSGNAQGYKLHFPVTEKAVPVARQYAPLVKNRLLILSSDQLSPAKEQSFQ